MSVESALCLGQSLRCIGQYTVRNCSGGKSERVAMAETASAVTMHNLLIISNKLISTQSEPLLVPTNRTIVGALCGAQQHNNRGNATVKKTIQPCTFAQAPAPRQVTCHVYIYRPSYNFEQI